MKIESIEGFQATTLDVKAYQDGKVALLTDAEVAAKSYSSISLVLDHTTVADGYSPG